MANPERGEVDVIIGGKTHTYRLTAGACAEFKGLHGVSVLKAATSLGDEIDEGVLFDILYLGVKGAMSRDAFNEDATLADALAFANKLPEIMQVAYGTGTTGNAGAGEAANSASPDSSKSLSD